jgi:hypothetical protein
MKNKAVTIVCIVLIIAAIICFGYIFINSKVKEENLKKEEEVTPSVSEDVVQREERGQNVNVNSRIGLQLKELIKYSEIYSNNIIDELDENGITSKEKLLVALDKIYRVQEYQSYLEYSEEYSSTYILPENMNKVISSAYYDATIIENEVDGILSYDENTNVYIIVPRGFATGSIEYTVEVPYKIVEYSDRIELTAYRVYVTKQIEMNETESIVNVNFFYDKSKSIEALTISNDEDFSDDNQVEYLKDKIDSNIIDSQSLESVKYTFIKLDDTYKISSFENI